MLILRGDHPMYPKQKTSNVELVTLVSLGGFEHVKQFLSEGWDPNVCNQDGITPAHKAAERNDLAMLKLLIDAGAKVDVQDFSGITPLKYAQFHKNEKMIQLIENTIQASAKSEFSYKK